MGGLSGTLIIEGFQQQVPATEPLKERLLALKEFSPDPKGDLNRVPKPYNVVVKTINGQLMPRIDIQPGETQLWRLSDQTADAYFRLRLEGHTFTIVGSDPPCPAPRDGVGGDVRAERADGRAGHRRRGGSLQADRRADRDGAGRRHVRGPEHGLDSLARDPAVPPRRRSGPVANGRRRGPAHLRRPTSTPRTRHSSFSEDPLVTGLFFINHATFDPDRVDFKVPLGSIEEWTIRNASEELHVFHIHQLPFQVISVNGKPVPFDGLMTPSTCRSTAK